MISISSSGQKPILFIGATAHIGNGEMIKNSAISIKNGKFDLVADATMIRIDPNAFDTIYKTYGKHIYPSFILPNTTLGITEIDAVRASDDEDEIGEFLPNIRSAIAYNAESKIVESVRPNGVLIAQITPRGGTISGSSSVMQLDAWNWEDALIKTDEGIHLNWPNPYSRGRWWLGEDPALKENKNYSKSIETIKNFFDEAKIYSNQNPKHLPYSSMKGIYDGSKTIYLHASYEKQIIDGVSFLNDLRVS